MLLIGAASSGSTHDGLGWHPGPMPSARVVVVKARSLLLAAALVGILVSGCGSQRQVSSLRVRGVGGKFAGYLWQGDVRSVSASWVIPALREGSELGKASTWIGETVRASVCELVVTVGFG
jgi:hypothetical protein